MIHTRAIKQEDIAALFSKIATLFAAGIPLAKSMSTLAHASPKQLHSLINNIKSSIEMGHSLSQTCDTYPEYFDPFTIQLLRIGEHTGKIDIVLKILANHYEQKRQLSRQLRQILFYPTCILITAVVTVTFMLYMVIPKFAAIFAASDKPLPWVTNFIFALSDCLIQHPFLIATTCLSVILIGIYLTQLRLFAIMARLPYFKQLTNIIALQRFSHQLAICLQSGITLIDALPLTIGPQSQAHFAYHIFQIRNHIRRGESLSQASKTYLPAMLIEFIRIGETSGTLATMLFKAADLYQANLTRRITRLTQLLEPLIMLVLGALIGGLVIGMYLPIFNLGNTLS